MAPLFGSGAADSIETGGVDQEGNTYVYGAAGDALGFTDDGGAPTIGAAGAFVAKFATDGHPVWAKSFVGTLPGPKGLVVDKLGHVYVAGNYYAVPGSFTMPSWGGLTTNLPNTGANSSPDGYDIFLLRIDGASGELQKAQRLGAATDTTTSSVWGWRMMTRRSCSDAP